MTVTDGTIFAVGAVVFVMGVAALVLYGLYEFDRWHARDAEPGDAPHLADLFPESQSRNPTAN